MHGNMNVKFLATFVYNTGVHNTVNYSSRLPISAYIHAIIRPIHYLDRNEKEKKKPYNVPYIKLGKRFHFLHPNVT